MPTLKTRLAALEAATETQDDAGGLVLALGPIMTEAQWCEAAAKQQAQLVKDTYEKNA